MATQTKIDLFVARANEFCRVLEEERRGSRDEFRLEVLVSLLEPYEAGLALPDVRPQTSALICASSESTQRFAFEKSVIGKLEGDFPYWTIFEPFNFTTPEDPVVGILSDDLADIYFDVKGGLQALEEGCLFPLDVVWEWKSSFIHHWGRHAVNAIQAIHALVAAPDLAK